MASLSFIRVQQNFIKDVLKDINKKDAQLRRKAATHIKKKVSGKIKSRETSKPGEPPAKKTGKLLKGLTTRSGKYVAYVGFKKPGFHATILEFPSKTAIRKTAKGQSRGHMDARPVLFPTFAEETGAVKQILSEERV